MLAMLAQEKTLSEAIEAFLEAAVNINKCSRAVALLIEENKPADMFCRCPGSLPELKEDVEADLRKNYIFIEKRIETSRSSLSGSNDTDSAAYNIASALKTRYALVTPCYFNQELNAVLILGKDESDFTSQETDYLEQFSVVFAFAVNSIKTRELNKALQTGLMQSQKLETIGKLASGMAHDFSNLLSSIFGSLNILKKKASQTDEVLRLLDNIESCSIRARDLTRGLLSYGKPTAKQKEKVSLVNLLEDICKVINETFPKNVLFENRINGGLYNILGVGSEIYQVLLNLCVNAKEAMEEGGTLTITANNISVTDKNNYLYPYLDKNDYCFLSVEDTGSGISEENIQKIFDPYFSTKKRETGSGSGLGLYVTYGIIKAHGGFINVESKSGKGTRFNVYLPSYASVTKTKTQPAEKIILLADDEVMLRDLLAELLESSGYSIIKVLSGEEAIKVLTEEIKIDLLIIDYNMPGMNGLECTKKIRESGFGFPIILSTGSVLGKKIDEKKSGINKLLLKPYEFEQMLAVIEELLR